MHKLQGRREELEFVSDAAQSIQAERAGSKNFRRPLPLLLDVVFRVFIGILNPVVAAVVVSRPSTPASKPNTGMCHRKTLHLPFMDFGVRCQVHELWCTLALVTESLSGLPGAPFTEVLNVTDRSDPSLFQNFKLVSIWPCCRDT